MIAHLYNENAARNGGKTQAVYNCKQVSDGRWVQDIERGILPNIDPNPWQTDTSIGDWFYNRNWKFRPVSWVIYTLVDNVSKNGNLLLNVVQRPDGSLDPEVEAMLGELADWNAIHGEAIFSSRPWLVYGETSIKVKGGAFKEDFKYNSKEIRFTTKGDALYAIALGYPEDRIITIRSLAKPTGENVNTISNISMLGYDGKIEWTQTPEALVVTLPEKKVSELTVGLKIIGTNLKNMPLPPISSTVSPDKNGVYALTADDADLHGDQINVESKGKLTTLGYWDKGDEYASWNVQVAKPGKYKISASYATLNGGVDLNIQIGEQTLKLTSTATGEWDKFQTVDIGEVEFKEAGKIIITAKPADASKWKAINPEQSQANPRKLDLYH